MVGETQEIGAQIGRILLVEDEPLLLFDLASELRDLGFKVIGVTSLSDAQYRASNEPFDLAILDFDLGRHDSSSVADILLSRGIPIVFATACPPHSMPEYLRGEPRIRKPYRTDEIRSALSKVYDGSGM